MSEKLGADEDLEDLDEWNDSEWPEEDWLELVDYLSNDISPEARAATKHRLETDPNFARLAAPLLAAWPAPSPAQSKDRPAITARADSDAHIAQLFEGALGTTSKIPNIPAADVPANHGRRTMWPVWIGTALLLGSVAVYVGMQLAKRSSSSSAPATQFHIVPPASRDLVLADGTRVTLAPGAAILTGDSAQGNSRTVRLAGSGTFVVQSDPKRPFTVENHGVLVVAAIASTFSVVVQTGVAGNPSNGDGAPDDVATIHISVTDGKVMVQRAAKDGRQEAIGTLGPGEEISVSQH